jgi:hypothetical protein
LANNAEKNMVGWMPEGKHGNDPLLPAMKVKINWLILQ